MRKSDPDPIALIEKLFHLHRRQAVLHNLDRAVDRISDTNASIGNIPPEKGFIQEGSLNRAGKHLAEAKRLVMAIRDDIARSVDQSENEIGEAIGWSGWKD